MAAAQVLVLETCGGLVTGAAAERLGGFGTVCSAYTGRSPPSQDAVRMFNFPWAMRDSLCCASLERLSAAAYGDGTASQQAGEGATGSQLANDSVTNAQASSADAVLGQLEAIASPLPTSGDATQPPEAPASTEQPGVAVGCDAVGGADGMSQGAEAACNGPRCAALSAADQAVEQAQLQNGDTATDIGCDDVPPALSAVAAQHLEATRVIGEQDRSQLPVGGRIPRNMEPKRCITAVPPARLEQLRALVQPGFDSCLIAAPALQPLAAVERLLPFLAPSAFFVVFSPFLQPLAEAMAALQASKAASNLQLQVCRALVDKCLKACPWQIIGPSLNPIMPVTGASDQLSRLGHLSASAAELTPL